MPGRLKTVVAAEAKLFDRSGSSWSAETWTLLTSVPVAVGWKTTETVAEAPGSSVPIGTSRTLLAKRTFPWRRRARDEVDVPRHEVADEHTSVAAAGPWLVTMIV